MEGGSIEAKGVSVKISSIRRKFVEGGFTIYIVYSLMVSSNKNAVKLKSLKRFRAYLYS
jgi:hypothetical protein